MIRSAKADIDPALLVWARRESLVSLEDAARSAGVGPSRLSAWESGAIRPTVNQLRRLSRRYNVPFAAFFLQAPPTVRLPQMGDYRLLPGGGDSRTSPNLVFEIRRATERRDTSLELYAELERVPPRFDLEAGIHDEPERIGSRVREALGMSISEQHSWRDRRTGFNSLRGAVEHLGVLVLQATELTVHEMRGFSISEFPVPVVVINRRDTPAARSFTLLHELAHIMLRMPGICDVSGILDSGFADQPVEVFCNAVAAAILVPREFLLLEDVVKTHVGDDSWEDDTISEISLRYSVSQEVVLRRLLTLGLTSWASYRSAANRIAARYSLRQQTTGYVHPAVDVVSSAGKFFVSLVLDAYSADRISLMDVSDYLGIRLKHLPKIAEAIEVPWSP